MRFCHATHNVVWLESWSISRCICSKLFREKKHVEISFKNYAFGVNRICLLPFLTRSMQWGPSKGGTDLGKIHKKKTNFQCSNVIYRKYGLKIYNQLSVWRMGIWSGLWPESGWVSVAPHWGGGWTRGPSTSNNPVIVSFNISTVKSIIVQP